MRGPRAEEAVRFAMRAAAAPWETVARWKAISGWKAAACPAGFPAPEVLHAVELLPVAVASGCPGQPPVPCDAAVVAAAAGRPARDRSALPRFTAPGVFPEPTEDALDLLETLAEWAASVTARPCTEGALVRSLRAYHLRDNVLRELRRRCAAEAGFLDGAALYAAEAAGRCLPVETHGLLLGRILGESLADAAEPEEFQGDPLLYLARRAKGAVL